MGTEENKNYKSLLISQAQLPRSKHATLPVLGDVCTDRILLCCLLGISCRKQSRHCWSGWSQGVPSPTHIFQVVHNFILPWVFITMPVITVSSSRTKMDELWKAEREWMPQTPEETWSSCRWCTQEDSKAIASNLHFSFLFFRGWWRWKERWQEEGFIFPDGVCSFQGTV